MGQGTTTKKTTQDICTVIWSIPTAVHGLVRAQLVPGAMSLLPFGATLQLLKYPQTSRRSKGKEAQARARRTIDMFLHLSVPYAHSIDIFKNDTKH
jgi:hypothetical protein